MSAQVFLSFSAPRPTPLQKEAAVVINHGKLFCFSPVFWRKVGGNCEKKMGKVKESRQGSEEGREEGALKLRGGRMKEKF